MIIVIYMKCLYCLGYHIRNPPNNYVESRPFAVCSDHGTWQSYHSLSCAKVTAHGKEAAFAVCQAGKAHDKGSCPVILTVVPKSLPWVRFGIRQRLCRVLEILHTAKAAFADGCLPCALCRVRHTAKPLPWVSRALPCAVGTRQTRRLP